jgi:hypothetical protein
MRLIGKDTEVPCNCVFRAVFRACYNRFRQCSAQSGRVGSVSLEFCRGREGRRSYARKGEEFAADFCLVSRRSLNEFEYKLFKYHFLLGANWKLCCRQLKTDRGSFFHSVYRIEQKLGRIFASLRPYGLYPINEYFNGVVHKEGTANLPQAA